MHCKITSKKYPNGKITYYAAIVESYWDKEKKFVTQRVIRKIGMVTKEQGELLKKIFHPKVDCSKLLNILDKPADASVGKVYYAGHSYLLSEIWDNFGFSEYIDKKAKNTFAIKVSKIAKLMVLNRLIYPCSENYLTTWYNTFSDAIRFFIPLTEEQLHYRHLYRYMREINRIFPDILKFMYKLLKKNIHNGQNPDCLYYDITSTYFEGTHTCILAQYGYSRDKRSDKKQVVLALVTDSNGFPIYAEVMPGNTSDKTTVDGILKKMKKLFGITNCLLIGDRGMISDDNFEKILKNNFQYLMALDRNHIQTVLADNYPEIKKMKNGEQIIIEVENKFYVVSYNAERKETENETRKKNIDKIIKRLNYLKTKFEAGHKNYDSPDKISYWLGKMDSQFNSRNYYTYSFNKETSEFIYSIHENKISETAKWDGYFVLESSLKSAIQNNPVDLYRGLSNVEAAFKRLKSDLDARPIYHRNEETIKGHIYIVIISYFIEKYIEWTLKNKLKISTSVITIIEQLKQISIVEKKINNVICGYELSQYDDSLNKILECFDMKSIKILHA